MENIFSRLYKYKPQYNMTPEENFFTEGFKFILELDPQLCDKFVKFISGESLFCPPFTLDSQVRYNNSIIDLELTDKNNKKLLVEIKVSAHENRYIEEEGGDYGQIEKYLRLNLGHVCFISNRNSDIEIKSNGDTYLGQFQWFQIYELVEEHYKSKTDISELSSYFVINFLKFMKDLDMQPFQGFTEKDIEISHTTQFDFYSRLADFLAYVKSDERIVKFFKKHSFKFGIGSGLNGNQHISNTFRKESWKRFDAGFGFWYFDEETCDYYSFQEGPGMYYVFYIWLPADKREQVKRGVDKFDLDKKYFSEELEGEYTVYTNMPFYKFIEDGEKKAIDYIYESLLELEKQGVFQEIGKVMEKST